jgi:pimeloyl-ACP methyl ester carboxylesterase
MVPSGQMATGWLREPNARDTAVVFVHGIFSGGVQCWSAAGGAFWPALLAREPGLEAVGIFVFSYRTSAFSKTYSVGDIVDALREELKLTKIREYRRVIFVCHSMGGIVVRKYLVARQVDLIERGTEIGLFMVASPSLGSVQAGTLYPLLGLLRNTQAKILRFSQQNVWLNDLDKDFTDLLASRKVAITGKELVEDLPLQIFRWRLLRVRLFRQTVPPYSAAKYFGESFKVPGSDHGTICKPSTAADIQHRLLVDFVTRMIADAAPTYSISVQAGWWTLEALAKELVARDDDGAFLACDRLSAAEREAPLIEKKLTFDSIAEGLELLQHMTETPIRKYRVEHVGREYRIIPL